MSGGEHMRDAGPPVGGPVLPSGHEAVWCSKLGLGRARTAGCGGALPRDVRRHRPPQQERGRAAGATVPLCRRCHCATVLLRCRGDCVAVVLRYCAAGPPAVLIWLGVAAVIWCGVGAEGPVAVVM
eukprot:7643446-Pyramimonas_sp.AAC.2